MQRMFFTIAAIFVQSEFFRRIYFIAHGNIVLMLTDRTDERKE